MSSVQKFWGLSPETMVMMVRGENKWFCFMSSLGKFYQYKDLLPDGDSLLKETERG